MGQGTGRIRIALAAVVVALVTACSGSPAAPPAPGTTASPGTAASPGTGPAATRAPGSGPTGTPTTDPGPVTHPTVWLCRPGLPRNPCAGGLDTEVVKPDGSRAAEPFRPAADAPVDCFYVYPTVSTAPGRNAPLRATAAEVDTVRAQAARFGAVCRLFAPVYRQVTLRGLATGGLTDRAARALAHGDVVSAWHDYLRQNPGRRFVLIGHSQGTFELTQLIQEEIDGDPALRSRLVSALLIGGYVAVDRGRDTGTFRSVPACRRAGQTGCVVAYNSYAGAPPAGSLFGRIGTGQDVLCVNPAAVGGGAAALRPYVPAGRGFTAYPGALRAECRRGGGASWLQVRGVTPAAARLLGNAGSSPAWGLHRADVNLALGDLVDLVRTQAAA